MRLFFKRDLPGDSLGEHARIYNRMGDELRRQYGGQSGSITDRAKNYAGGWDYALRDPEDAARRAELWQLADYLKNPLSETGRLDAAGDLEENLAGIRDALQFVGPPDPYNQLKARAVDWAKRNPRCPPKNSPVAALPASSTPPSASCVPPAAQPSPPRA